VDAIESKLTDELPMSRSLLPVQSLARSIPLIIIVGAIVVIGAAVFQETDPLVHALAMIAGLGAACPALRLLLPSRLTLTGPSRDAALNRVINLIEQPSVLFGFRYVRSADSNRWRPVGPDLYPWDPSIRVRRTETQIFVIGPACIMKSIPMAI
jgi:hypothetical protein